MKKSFTRKAVMPSLQVNPTGAHVWQSTCPDSLGVHLLLTCRDLIPKKHYRPLLGMFRYGLENQGEPRTGEGTYEGLFKIVVDRITFPYRPIEDSLGALKGVTRLLGGFVLLNTQPVINQETGEHDNDWEIVYSVILPGKSTRKKRPEWEEIMPPDEYKWYRSCFKPDPDNPF